MRPLFANPTHVEVYGSLQEKLALKDKPGAVGMDKSMVAADFHYNRRSGQSLAATSDVAAATGEFDPAETGQTALGGVFAGIAVDSPPPILVW